MLFPISQEDILRLAQVVREETGNQVQNKNFSMLEARMRTHVTKLKFKTMSEYWTYFQTNETSEREALQSLMTTHYTFFFREFAHFEVLKKWIDDNFVRLKASGRPVRVWSAACSRGQEVYSLAMFLEQNLTQEHGVKFEIIGTDIDSESVAFSLNGVYPLKEVNTIPHIYLNGHWKKGTGPIADFAAVHPNLKANVKFEVLNLLEIKKWQYKSKFDVIFCRNVFIYFSDENVRAIALDLLNCLQPMGLLVSGMSEPLHFAGWDLPSLGPSCYFNGAAPTSVKPILDIKTTAQNSVRPQAANPLQATPVVEKIKYRVLCVDDSPTIQTLIKKIFAQDTSCTRVEVANNGREAREKLDAAKYDLITLDIHMPEVNGIEFLERLYQRNSDPPVLMVSSVNRTDIELATKSISLGAFDYVEKPGMNNLQKSADEILTKAKMALRAKRVAVNQTVGGFDASIAQKIVVPDASQCLRIIVASEASSSHLQQVIKGQLAEYRSPATLVAWRGEKLVTLESDLLKCTDRQLISLRDNTQVFKPNAIYLASKELTSSIFASLKYKSISLQILDSDVITLDGLKKSSAFQILVDESAKDSVVEFEHATGFKVSDITPSTSFPSLSVEFFANLRKAA
jgi:chemotaxis protein methyltransferase CheR